MKTTKKTLIFLCLCLMVFSCSSSDDAKEEMKEEYKDLILNTWYLKSRTINNINDSSTNPCNFQVQLSFRGDLFYSKFERFETDCNTTTQSTGSYTISGNNLTVSRGQITENSVITLLDKKNLTIRFTDGRGNIIENYERPN